MRIFVDLSKDDVQMMRIVSQLQQENGCSPKKWLVLGRFKQKSLLHSNSEAESTFRKLVLLDVIEHSRNGHCWLTDKGAQACVA